MATFEHRATVRGRVRHSEPHHGFVRLRVWCTRLRLDAELAAGAPPGLTPELTERARQVCRPRYRRAMAAGLERAVRVAEADRHAPSVTVPVARREVLGARRELLEVAARLRDEAPVAPAGVASVALLLTDGSSRLYCTWPGSSLRRHARDTADRLDHGPR